jgi:hypothetical protein
MSFRSLNIRSLAALDQALQKDRQSSPAELLERDKEVIANRKDKNLDLSTKKAKKLSILSWLNSLGKEIKGNFFLPSGGILFLLGIICGALTAGAVFYFDGTHPVNIAIPLLALVVVPFIFTLFSLFLLLPVSFLEKLPIIGSLIIFLKSLNPTELFYSATRKVKSSETALSISPSVLKWHFAACSQVFSVAFLSTAIACFLLLVSFTDLAFSWGSTLNIAPEKVHSVSSAIATPWKHFLPEANPSLEMVKETRFFRLSSGETSLPTAKKFGNWWYFIALCIFTYGLIPRLILFVVVSSVRDILVRREHFKLPGVQQLLFRLSGKSPAFRATEGAELSEETSEPSSGLKSDLVKLEPLDINSKCSFLTLNFTLSDEQKNQLSSDKTELKPDTLALKLSGEEQRAEDLVQQASSFFKDHKETDCYLMVKSWDIPLEENVELISDLSTKLPKGKQLHILPVDCSDPVSLKCPSERHEKVWAAKLSKLSGKFPVVVNTFGDNCAG